MYSKGFQVNSLTLLTQHDYDWPLTGVSWQLNLGPLPGLELILSLRCNFDGGPTVIILVFTVFASGFGLISFN